MDIPLLQLLTFLPLVFMIGALPVTVAHLGTSQAAWIFFFSDYAAEADLLAYSLVLPPHFHAGERDDWLAVHAEGVFGSVREEARRLKGVVEKVSWSDFG